MIVWGRLVLLPLLPSLFPDQNREHHITAVCNLFLFVSNAPVNNNPSLSDTGPRITSILFDWAGSGSLLRSTQCL